MARGERNVLAHDEDAPREQRVRLRFERPVARRFVERAAVALDGDMAVAGVMVEPCEPNEGAGMQPARRSGRARLLEERPGPRGVTGDEGVPPCVDRTFAAAVAIVRRREPERLFGQLGGRR